GELVERLDDLGDRRPAAGRLRADRSREQLDRRRGGRGGLLVAQPAQVDAGAEAIAGAPARIADVGGERAAARAAAPRGRVAVLASAAAAADLARVLD